MPPSRLTAMPFSMRQQKLDELCRIYNILRPGLTKYCRGRFPCVPRTRRRSQNRKYMTYRNVNRHWLSCGRRRNKHCREVGEVWTCDFWDTRADRPILQSDDFPISAGERERENLRTLCGFAPCWLDAGDIPGRSPCCRLSWLMLAFERTLK